MSAKIVHAVLLAAGKGTRLLPMTADRPKCMVSVLDELIVDSTLDALEELGIEHITVVTGYQNQRLQDYLREQKRFAWTFIHNERYATTNNILSLQVAAESITAPFVLVESDIYVERDLLLPLAEPDRVLVSPYLPSMDGTGIVVGGEDEVREMVIRAHLARKDSLDLMHKTVNFYSFSAETWKRYRAALDAWVEEERLDEYYEAVLAELINRGEVQMKAAVVSPDRWAEVDDMKDLEGLESRLRSEG